jgi:solute carrier family 26 protein
MRANLFGDAVSGLTVAIMHIPQGMAYGLLAGVDPIVGLYMAFFPVLIYFLFGTSRHVSMGTFAIISIMTSKIVATYSDPNYGSTNLNATMDENADNLPIYPYSPFQVATAVSMVCGFYQLIMCVLRLGILSSLLSEALVNGFTTAAAVQVLVSQLKDVLGLKLPRHQGAFKILLSLRDIVLNLPNANMYAIYIAILCIGFMVIMNEVVKPWAAKKCKFPIPTELMAVVGFTALSYFLNLGGPDFKVREIGKIPTGLPMPEMPPLELLSLVAVDSIAVCIVSYSIVMSMALIFAKKDYYEVRPNQELLALGLSNIFGSFFSCIPMSCSLSRSMIQYMAGGKTQLTSVFSAAIILTVLLWLGPLFETLPRACLASTIIVALKGLLMQVMDLKRFLKEGILESAEWIGTFLVVVIIDIDVGLLAGVVISVLALYIKGLKSYSSMLGQVPDTDIYVPLQTHKNVSQLPNIKIFRYSGSVNFATCSGFKKALFSSIGVDCRLIRRASLCETQSEARSFNFNNGIKCLVLDLGSIAHIDMSGYRTFLEIRHEMKLIDVRVYLANASDCVYDSLMHAVELGHQPFECFSSLHDAVLFAQRKTDQ